MSDTIPDQDGVTIVLSPAQLAAVMQGESVSQSSSMVTRASGLLTVVGGALELAVGGALLLTPEPTMVTKAGGWIIVAHGADTAASGLTEVWTGRRTVTLTQQGIAAAARLAGVDASNAEQVGVVVDFLVPMAVAGALAAVRAVAIRRGTIRLAAEEAAGGHTILKHVNKTEAELRARLLAEPRITAASSFRNLEAAESAVSRVLRAKGGEITSWAAGARPGARLRLDGRFVEAYGSGVVRATGRYTELHGVRVILQRVDRSDRVYFVLTAFPIP
jgi:hypothetical protein